VQRTKKCFKTRIKDQTGETLLKAHWILTMNILVSENKGLLLRVKSQFNPSQFLAGQYKTRQKTTPN